MRLRTLVLATLVAGLLSACAAAVVESPVDPPAVVESITGSDIKSVTLSESASERLGIEVTGVSAEDAGLAVPSAAVIITTDGKYWVYTNPEPLVFVREEIRPVVEEAGRASYSTGPAAGTLVVTTGVPELYGAEFGVGK